MWRVMTPKKGAGEFTARPETKLRTIISVEILWWAGTSPTCGTMAPPNEGEDCEQCPISTQSGSRSSQSYIAKHCTSTVVGPYQGKVLFSSMQTYICKCYQLVTNPYLAESIVYTLSFPYINLIYSRTVHSLPWLIDTAAVPLHITKLNIQFLSFLLLLIFFFTLNLIYSFINTSSCATVHNKTKYSFF